MTKKEAERLAMFVKTTDAVDYCRLCDNFDELSEQCCYPSLNCRKELAKTFRRVAQDSDIEVK